MHSARHKAQATHCTHPAPRTSPLVYSLSSAHRSLTLPITKTQAGKISCDESVICASSPCCNPSQSDQVNVCRDGYWKEGGGWRAWWCPGGQAGVCCKGPKQAETWAVGAEDAVLGDVCSEAVSSSELSSNAKRVWMVDLRRLIDSFVWSVPVCRCGLRQLAADSVERIVWVLGVAELEAVVCRNTRQCAR